MKKYGLDYAEYNICTGCNRNCSFCKVHYMNWKLISQPYDEIINNLETIIKQGVKCLEIFGSSVAQYGYDLYGKPRLHEILEYLYYKKEVKRIDVWDINPADCYPQLIEELVRNYKVKEVRISVQTGSDRILKLMNRGHTVQEANEILQKLRKRKDLIISTTIMSSFPTETTDDIKETIEFIKENELDVTYIYKYLNSKNIPSSNLKQLSEHEYYASYNTLSFIIKKISNKVRKSWIGKRFELFVENDGYAYIGEVPVKADGLELYKERVVSCVLLNYSEEQEMFSARLIKD